MGKVPTRLLPWLAALLVLVSGCANMSTATVSPDTDLRKVKSFYVVKQPADNRGTEKLISAQLVKMGYTARSGPELPAANYDADVVVTYVDKWMWDITMYMLELTITFRAPNSGYALASGHSLHTSLTRRSPEEMVEEVLTSIFSKAKQGS